METELRTFISEEDFLFDMLVNRFLGRVVT